MKYLIIVVILNICYSQVEYSKDLIEGYNWFSINLLTDDMSINSILSSLNENPSYIISQQNGFSIYYQGFGWYGRLQELNAESMYKILMLGNATLSYSGQIMDTNEHTILLNEGWNWIGYIPNTTYELDIALTSIENNGSFIKSSTETSTYYEGFGWYGTLDIMKPSEGYIIEMTNNAILTYPPTENNDNPIFNSSREIPDWYINPHAFSAQNQVVPIVIGGGCSDDILAAFGEDGSIRGVASVIELPSFSPYYPGYSFDIQIYSNIDFETISFKYYQSSTDTIIDIAETIEFQDIDQVLGDAMNPYIFNIFGDDPCLSDNFSGDLNYDGLINILDVVILVNLILGNGEIIDGADLNNDDQINILDVVLLVNLILGN